MGLQFTAQAASTGLHLTSFRPKVPATLPSPDAVFQGAFDTKSDIIFCVPSFVEVCFDSSRVEKASDRNHIQLWSKNPGCVAHLATVKAVVGSPCSMITNVR